MWKKKKTSRNTQKDIRQKEASPISLTTSLLSSTKRQGHGNFTDARSSVIALPPQAMQAVFSAQLPSLQCCGYRSEGSPLLRYQSRQTSCLLCMGRVIQWIAFRTCTWLLCGSIHTSWIAQFILPSVVDMIMKNEISCTTTALPRHYQGTIAALPRHYYCTTTALPGHYCCNTTALPQHYQGTITALPGHYHSTTGALLLHYHYPTTVLPGTIAALPLTYHSTTGHCCCTTTTHRWSWHGHVLTCRALWRRFCRLSRRTVSCGSISRHDDTLSCRLQTQQTLNVRMACILVTNNSFRDVLNSVVRCSSCCGIPQINTVRVIQYMQLHIDKCIPSVG